MVIEDTASHSLCSAHPTYATLHTSSHTSGATVHRQSTPSSCYGTVAIVCLLATALLCINNLHSSQIHYFTSPSLTAWVPRWLADQPLPVNGRHGLPGRGLSPSVVRMAAPSNELVTAGVNSLDIDKVNFDDFEDDGLPNYELDDDSDGNYDDDDDDDASSGLSRQERRKQWYKELRPTLVAKAQAAGFFRPTSVQRRAIPVVLSGQDVVIHAETGAGKTLAFVLPLVQKLQAGTPFQALIVCPSSELAVQTAQVITKVWDLEMPAVGLVVAGNSPAAQYEGLTRKRPAIIIGAARQLDLMFEDKERREALLGPVRTLVLDEVDALLPPPPTELLSETIKKQAKKRFEEADFKERRRIQRKGFTVKDLDLKKVSGKERRLLEVKPGQRILDYVNLHKPKMQLICASATADTVLVNFLNLRAKKYDSFKKIRVVSAKPVAPPTKGLRSRGVAGVGVPSRIVHQVVINRDGDGEDKLRNVLKAFKETQPWSVLMAVGNTESVNGWVSKLRFRGIKHAAPLHELMGFGPREDGFRLDAATHLAKHRELLERFQSHTGEPFFIVTTQANCRGIDLKGVDVVYLTALPKNTDEYQHISGRSGREGRRGKAISFLEQKEVWPMKQYKKDLGIAARFTPEELIPDPLGPTVVDGV